MLKRFANSHSVKQAAVAFICAASLASCQSSSPPPEKMARTTTDTAPADLQLLCANAAATTAKIESSKILPISSARVDDQNYTVQLDASGKKFTCTVDVNGTVKSVVPTATP